MEILDGFNININAYFKIFACQNIIFRENSWNYAINFINLLQIGNFKVYNYGIMISRICC